MKLIRAILLSFITIVVSVTILSFTCFAEEGEGGDTAKLQRDITMAAQYTGIIIPQDERVNIGIFFINQGKRGEDVNVWVDKAPQGWKTYIETNQFEITGIYVPAGKEKTLTFKAIPPENVKTGKYLFGIAAKTKDSKFKMQKWISVEIKKKKQNKSSKGVKITSFYPVLKGPVRGKFEFSIMVKSDMDREAVFSLIANGPEGWDISFKPTLEATYVSSIRLQPYQSKNLSVLVKPTHFAAPGEYNLKIKASTEGAEAGATLKVILTGSYGLKVGTAKGLLSLEARPGQKSNVSIYVKNTGSAENKDITFSTFKPENWQVEFNPERINLLKPNEFKQVEVTITPYEKALVGDYSLEVKAKGAGGSKGSVEFRVTVKANPLWGWAGVGIIALVISGLILTFKFFGRR